MIDSNGTVIFNATVYSNMINIQTIKLKYFQIITAFFGTPAFPDTLLSLSNFIQTGVNTFA